MDKQIIRDNITQTDKQLNKILITASLTVIVVVALWKLPEVTKAYATRETETKLGEYVYVDMNEIIHADRKCPRLNYKHMKSKRIKTVDLSLTDESSFCPKCVSDKIYEELKGK